MSLVVRLRALSPHDNGTLGSHDSRERRRGESVNLREAERHREGGRWWGAREAEKEGEQAGKEGGTEAVGGGAERSCQDPPQAEAAESAEAAEAAEAAARAGLGVASARAQRAEQAFDSAAKLSSHVYVLLYTTGELAQIVALLDFSFEENDPQNIVQALSHVL